MGMEFGWWDKDDEGTKWHIKAPTDEQWDRLISEAERRLPRRLMSTKEFNQLKGQRPT
jgi:hypothetical protein